MQGARVDGHLGLHSLDSGLLVAIFSVGFRGAGDGFRQPATCAELGVLREVGRGDWQECYWIIEVDPNERSNVLAIEILGLKKLQ